MDDERVLDENDRVTRYFAHYGVAEDGHGNLGDDTQEAR
jgi:hypothetical protein